jgi:hypothetical protein
VSLVNLLIGLAALLFGRQLYWLFVAAAGFVLGFNLAQNLLQTDVAWLAIVIGLAVGALGALLAVFFQRLAIAIAGFVTGGYLLGQLAASLQIAAAADTFAPVNLIIYIVGGIIGAVLVTVFFDPALILLSAILGATLTTPVAAEFLNLDPTLRAVLYIVLLVLGIGVQWSLWSDRTWRRERR